MNVKKMLSFYHSLVLQQGNKLMFRDCITGNKYTDFNLFRLLSERGI